MRILLQLLYDPLGYDITLRALGDYNSPVIKAFQFAPVPISALRLESTTTTARLSWRLPGGLSVTALELYHTFTHTLVHRRRPPPSHTRSSYEVGGLKPGSRYTFLAAVTTTFADPRVTLTQYLRVGTETAGCPVSWQASGRNCYSVRRRGLPWPQAQRGCRALAAGTHLADVQTQEELLFLSAHLLTYNTPLLLWTALNDLREEGRPRWSDGSAHNLTGAETSPWLPSNQTDCFALQRNATGPGYFLTPFFCRIALPFICQCQVPLVPPSFTSEVARVTESEVELRWSDLSPLTSSQPPDPQIFVRYQESISLQVPVSPSSGGVTVTGLSPGKVYSLSLRASHDGGVSWSLGQTHVAHTRPLTPRNVSVSNITDNEVTVKWHFQDTGHNNSFVVRYVDMTTGHQSTAGRGNVTQSSVIGGLETYSAAIGGLVPYRKYRIEVYTVTGWNVESCAEPIITHTALSSPRDLAVWSADTNLTVCWSHPPTDPPDGFLLTSRPLAQPRPAALWVNESSAGASWTDVSVCVALDKLTPGQTYRVAVASVRGGDRSRDTSALHTIVPGPVQVAVPLSVGASSVALFVQRPLSGLMDGVEVCACAGTCEAGCDGACQDVCDWQPLPQGTHTVTVDQLRPGAEYQFRVCSTSRERRGPPYYTQHVRTSLAPPCGVREGVVTDSSIELIWDPASGHGHSYEVICLDCQDTLRVQKVSGQRAVFSSLMAGRLYHFAVRTEKETYTDSPPVTLNITAAPSPVHQSILNKTTTSVTVAWQPVTDRGVVSGFLLSIKNHTHNRHLNFSSREPRRYRFEGLSPGSHYTIEVISTNGGRKGKQATADISTFPGAPEEVRLGGQAVTSVLLSWRPPPGQVEGYKLKVTDFTSEGLGRQQWWHELRVQGTSYEMKDLIPGSDYGLCLQSLLGSDTSLAVHKRFSTRPAGVHSLSLLHLNSSSAAVSWEPAAGPFDHHAVTVTGGSDARSLRVPKEEREATVTGLADGCGYNVSVARVRGGLAGSAASLRVTPAPAPVRDVRVVNISAHAFTLRWAAAGGCVDQYRVQLTPAQGDVLVHAPRGGHVQLRRPAKALGMAFCPALLLAFCLGHTLAQANVASVNPGTQFTVTVTAGSSNNFSPPVSRIVSTNETAFAAPSNLEGERVGSNGILLSWIAPAPSTSILRYIIRYKEVCPYPQPSFTQEIKYLDAPETLLNSFTPGSTYNIQVAAENMAGVGAFSKSLYIKTAEAPPGLVTNLTAFAQNHTFVVVTWFLPRRINGLITKFAVKAKYARTTQTVRTLEINAEDIMTVALPHCNDAADILSRGTPSPAEVTALTASVPPVTLSAVPPAAAWGVPISVGVDRLRPFTAYLFEVSAFTSDGEGQIASTMVRMPESAPEDSPQNLSIWNVTSKSISVYWDPPTIVTGRFTYVVYLFGPTGFLYENSTADLRFAYGGLTPYTGYRVEVRARSAGELGPEAYADVLTPSEAPSAVLELLAVAEDSVSVRVTWRRPAQPNGLIVRYRLLVLASGVLLQDITLTGKLNMSQAGLHGGGTLAPDVSLNSGRPKRSATDLSLTSSPPAFTATLADRTLPSSSTAASRVTGPSTNPTPLLSSKPGPSLGPSLGLSLGPSLGPHAGPSAGPVATEEPGTSATRPVTMATSSRTGSPLTVNPVTSSSTSALSLTSAPPATPLTWLTQQSQTGGMTSANPPSLTLTPGQPRLSTRSAVTGNGDPQTQLSTRAGLPGSPGGVLVIEEVTDTLLEQLSYLVSGLRPFRLYTFRVSASTSVGEGPSTEVNEKTREQVPSSVVGVSYQNISSTSILVSWAPPLSPNGLITHYTVYGLKLLNNQALQRTAYNTSLLLTGLDKYTGYKLRVAASTAIGESWLSDKDDIFVFTPEDEPDSPPLDLAVVETTPSTATLTWTPPRSPNGVIRQYEVLYQNRSFSATLNSTAARATLSLLRPYSHYNVSVRAYTLRGHGNQMSDTLRMLSGEDVPGGPPYDLAYTSVSPSEVNVTWRPPLVPNGVITHYSLELWNATHSLNLTAATSHLGVAHLRKFARYRLVVQAHTRVGPGNHSSEPLNITTLEDAPDTPPRLLKARKLSDYEVELSWAPPVNANSDVLYYVVRVWNESSEVWQNVSVTSVVVAVDSASRYNASVSSWTRLGDGGVLVFISFSVLDAVPFDPPQNVSLVYVKVTSTVIAWSPPTEPNGLILHYTIYYSDNTTIATQIVPVSQLSPLSLARAYSYTLSGLRGGTNYSLWLSSSTVQGDGGVRSPPLTFLTREDVPSDPVHNLSAQIFSSIAIIVSWDPPREPNGRPFYLLTLQEAGLLPPSPGPHPGPPAVNKTESKTTTDTVYLFTKLRKYFPYVFTVTPATGAGPALNHTRTLHLRTDDDIPSSPPVLVSTKNVSATSLSVVWQPPLEANGEITDYSLTLSGPGGSNSTQTPRTSATLTNLLPYTPYNLSVIASTRKGSGPALLLLLHTDEAGPMSPPRNLTIHNHTAFSVWLTWEPSLEPNGVVTHYGFRIRELISHTVSHQNSSGPWTQAHLSGFKPHSSYEISVSSYTRVGHGDQYSLPVSFTTKESVSDMVGNLSCSGVSWESVQLAWEPPANPNGQILFYQIEVGWGTTSHTHTTDALEYNVSGLAPDRGYTFTVTPFNSAGPGDEINCTAATHPESVPGVPRFLSVTETTPTSVTLQWAPPLSAAGRLSEYRVTVQRLSPACDPKPGQGQEQDLASRCVDLQEVVSVNGSVRPRGNHSATLHSLAKYRHYRFSLAAVTKAGEGEPTPWAYTRTLAGKPDVPPQALEVTPTSNSLHIKWGPPAILSGPTSYLIDVISWGGQAANQSVVRAPGEITMVVVSNLTAFSLYTVTVTAFTGPLEEARIDGQATEPTLIRTEEEKPKDPPTNVNLSVVPDEVTSVMVTFSPPGEPNGNISSYTVLVYHHGQLETTIRLVNVTRSANHTLTAVIEGLKGGRAYSIRIAAVNGAGLSPPSSEVQITMGIKAPAKPVQRPQAVLDRGGVAVVTPRTITVRLPACFFNDNNGPIRHIQIIVAESGVMNSQNVTNWTNAFLLRPAPYLTDGGFPNPACAGGRATADDTPASVRDGRRLVERRVVADTYVIGDNDSCQAEANKEALCNGPLKPNTLYVFKFRATNIMGQHTDSYFSELVRTAVDGLLTREEQIIMGVLLSFFLAVFLIVLIYASVRIRQRKKEGGTYSPREAEIIETKFKLDQLIAVADLELKEEKLKRYSSFFFRRKEIFVIQLLSYRKSLKPVNKKSFQQHVEDLCSNENTKFQEEFGELPKLLQDLATSDADLPWNRSKNRFTNIKPYNNNRVKLLSEPGLPGSDYINASFISGYLCPNEFIATQGPLPGTVADFWRMIWETRTRTVAMLTQCYEKGRIRCHQYWPEDNKPVTVFGDIIITKLTEDVHPDWTVRALKVERHGDYMVVHHFNYTSWPEHGVPESSSTLIHFVKAVRANRHENTTIAVHCSAGVGRTGVFIALDHLVQHVSDHDFVDVYGLVAELRSERMCMVQNLAQYMFLHQCTMDLLNTKGNSQSIWFVNYSALEKMDSLDAMEGDVELEWEETTM
ncbi:phosphatidylinositol phosphatase PTPRQ [Aplochiton taeniatus]